MPRCELGYVERHARPTGQVDRIEKVRDYAAVPSIRRYVILETRSVGLLVLDREYAEATWTATALMAGDILDLPEIGIGIPVGEFYEDVEFSPTEDA